MYQRIFSCSKSSNQANHHLFLATKMATKSHSTKNDKQPSSCDYFPYLWRGKSFKSEEGFISWCWSGRKSTENSTVRCQEAQFDTSANMMEVHIKKEPDQLLQSSWSWTATSSMIDMHTWLHCTLPLGIIFKIMFLYPAAKIMYNLCWAFWQIWKKPSNIKILPAWLAPVFRVIVLGM